MKTRGPNIQERSITDSSKQNRVYSNPYSQAVTHPSTNGSQPCLTSVIGRELVFSRWYGRRHLDRVHYLDTLSRNYRGSVCVLPRQRNNTPGQLSQSDPRVNRVARRQTGGSVVRGVWPSGRTGQNLPKYLSGTGVRPREQEVTGGRCVTNGTEKNSASSGRLV